MLDWGADPEDQLRLMEQTTHLPRNTVQDLFAADRPCPICDEVSLTVAHLNDLPDYVKCSSCESLFVLDAGSDLVMFGSISPDYPQTASFSLKRWLALPAVAAKAAEERSSQADQSQAQLTPQVDEADEQAAPGGEGPPAGTDGYQPADLPAPELPAAQPPVTADDADAAAQQAPFEPERGQRFRVIVQAPPIFPTDRCAHCYRTPASRRLTATGDFEPRRSFELPLCSVCHARVNAQSAEERNSRLIAHLSSVLVGAMIFVITLTLARLGVEAAMFLSIGMATALGALGYGATALITLSRLPDHVPSEDAIFVQTTALIQLSKKENGVAFSWRNSRYADDFLAANQQHVAGEITKVYESGRINQPAVTKR